MELYKSGMPPIDMNLVPMVIEQTGRGNDLLIFFPVC